jgi:hypothetical protein
MDNCASHPVIVAKLDTLIESNARMEKALLIGNGQPALITRVALCEERLATSKSNSRFNITTVIAVIGLLVAACAACAAVMK